MFRLLSPVALFLIVFAATALHCDASEPTPAVSTLSGQVRGTVRSAPAISTKPVFTFLGIPFAAPPVGDLRFRPPEPVVPWEGVMDATEFGPSCPQDLVRVRRIYDFIPFTLPHEIVSEDCLVLNIMTTSLDSSAALPVMVWIHGGSLVSGTGALYNFTALVAHQDVVVVTVNYRLGAFGFLSTGDDNAPGNYGFMDQVEALRWIKSNIRSFGGDPDCVTIFGESAGGLSVSYLVLSPLANGLFHRAISQSGTALTTPTTANPLAAATAQAEEIGCDHQDVNAMMSCLRQKPFQDIVDSASQVARKMGAFGASAFNPVVDEHFLLDPPLVALQKGEFTKVPYLLGVNNHEFGYLLSSLILPDFGNGMSRDVCAAIVKRVLSLAAQADTIDQTVAALLEEYRDPVAPDNPMAVQMTLTQILGDFIFLVPTVAVADNHAAQGGRVYLYEDHHRPGTSTKPAWVGCDHADDLVIMTGMPYLGQDGPTYPSKPLSFSGEDRELSLDMMTYWANFARTGNPSDLTGSPSVKPNLTLWPSYTPDNPAYLKLAVTSSAEVGLKANHVRFWFDILFNQPTPDAAKDTTGKEEL
ncbi:fatty acyl-CoA hydrolase precursor, medium chain-like isoform X1 [Branchiostoma lanceolatum]|uniref:fatty acyl-CoA hydrolase precursor, medium chain-like isoform X1 n=1 Tax=Branchiostoma lanceolatum TaxID=7740 RepID=UPI003453108F